MIKLTQSVAFTLAPLERADFIPDKSPFSAHSIRLLSYDKNKTLNVYNKISIILKCF